LLTVDDNKTTGWKPSSLEAGQTLGVKLDKMYTVNDLFLQFKDASASAPLKAEALVNGEWVKLFDGNVTDNCGGNTTPNKTITYKDGYYGQGVALNGGYVTLNDFDPSMESFTMSFWMKASAISSDPCIISNKNWDSGQYTGFALTFTNKNNVINVRLNYGESGNKRTDCDFALPSDYTNGWVHIIAIFDRENNKLGLSVDFADIKTSNIPENLQGTSLDAGLKTNIGQDGRGTYNRALPAIIDEFMIFEGAFTQEDVNALMEYYGIKIS
jgi:hypothetical protein